MTTDEAVKILLDNGYKGDKYSANDKEVISFYKRTESSECQCNKRSPNIGVNIFDIDGHIFMTINIKAESVSGRWVDTGYYSESIESLVNLKEMEYTITKSWECYN